MPLYDFLNSHRATAIPLLLVAALGAAATGCDRERPPDIIQNRADWTAVNDSLPPDPLAQARRLEAYRHARGFPLWFLPGTDAARSRLLIADSGHVCAPAIPAFVDSIPSGDSLLRPLTVLEADSTGRVHTRWRIPLGVTIVGVRGEALVTSVGQRPADVSLLIRPDGSFTIDTLAYERAARPVWPQGVCPGGAEFAPLICAEFRDGDRRRLILHPPACGLVTSAG